MRKNPGGLIVLLLFLGFLSVNGPKFFGLRPKVSFRVRNITHLEKRLNSVIPVQFPQIIYNAMRHSLLAGGKRVRGLLAIAAYEMIKNVKVSDTAQHLNEILPTACAVEMFHTSSLIMDDLPCMDDDVLRRGRLTCHVKYGEGNAVLAAANLITFGFLQLSRDTPSTVDRATVASVMQMYAARYGDMVVGQALDLASEENRTRVAEDLEFNKSLRTNDSNLRFDRLKFIHKHKTSSLIESSVIGGAMIAGGTPEDLARLTAFSEKIGLAFQIHDDVLDITKNSVELGKTSGKDEVAGKATYPELIGLDKSRELADTLVKEAIDILKPYGKRAENLIELAMLIVKRGN